MQTSTTAGYIDAPPLVRDTLRRLGAFRSEVPVLSLYLDLDPAEFGTQQARRSAYTSLLDEARKRVAEHGADNAAKRSLRADLERVQAFLNDYRPARGRGLAIFAASAAGLFEAYTLARSPRTRIAIGESPYVPPLLEGIDARDWLIVLVDARHARFLHGNPDHVEEFAHDEDHVTGQHERQSTSDHQRWVEHEVDVHLQDAAARLDRELRTGRFDRVLVGGSAEIAPRFAERHMSNPAREKLAGCFGMEVPDAVPDDVRAAAAPHFDEDERRHERAVLDRLAERLGRGERAAAGLADVCAMLEQARVETLLYDDGFEPPDPVVLEKVVEDAVAQSAEILPLRHHGAELRRRGQIAALLRF
ncbi:MAG TPA: hypothetical protein VNT54_01185 [Solirubrobacteraceae bacterium]|nr:hypothetical protein [Solirubrobacteraceae bacterium]